MTETIQGLTLIAGSASGEVIFTDEPLSFWGGYNAREGKIIDTHHALYGENVAGKIFVLPSARGSSTAYSNGLPLTGRIGLLGLPLLADCPEIEVEFIDSPADPFDPGELGAGDAYPGGQLLVA